MKDEEDAPPKQGNKGVELKLYAEQGAQTVQAEGVDRRYRVAQGCVPPASHQHALTDHSLERSKDAKVEFSVLKEYKKHAAEFDNRARSVRLVTEQRGAAKAKHDELCEKKLGEFTILDPIPSP